MSVLSRRCFTALALAPMATAPAWSQLPPPPRQPEKPLLTVSGHIANPNSGTDALFSRAGLESLGWAGFETATPWFQNRVRFEGVPMTTLMQAVGAQGSTVRAIALNDYMTDIPLSDFERFGTLLALKRDGDYMPVSDKGPLFIVYPFDSTSELQNRQYYGRSAWQVAKLVVS